MGSRNQMFQGVNPNKKNTSFSCPSLFLLAIDLLVEYGIYESKGDVIRAGVRRILKDNLNIIDSLNGVIEYTPIKRKRNDYLSTGKKIDNGYIIRAKDINEV